jgi:hypothetical protein
MAGRQPADCVILTVVRVNWSRLAALRRNDREPLAAFRTSTALGIRRHREEVHETTPPCESRRYLAGGWHRIRCRLTQRSRPRRLASIICLTVQFSQTPDRMERTL